MNKLARLSVQFVATFARTWANWRKPHVLANVATANSLFETAACFCVLGLWCCAVGGFLSGSAVFAQPTAGKGPSISELAVKSPHTALFNISDGTANTVFGGMVSENRAVPWTKPDDLVFDDTFQTKENSLVEGAVMFADGSIRHMQIQDGLDRAKFRLLFSIGDGQPSPLTSLYPPDHKFAPLTYKSVQDQVRQAEARSENKNSLKAIMLAFHNHHQVFKHFPPATVFGPDGKPWHSWRVLILPYLGQKELYDQYDATVPWDHPKNAAVLNKMPKVYRDPLSDKADSNKTRYLLVTGAGTAFPTKPTGNVVAQAPAQPNPAQPAPPKPVAKDGRQPIEYQPFNPAPWKAKNQSTWLFPWEGERVVLLTTTADLDAKTMAAFVKRLDAAWKLCGDLVGQSPNLIKQHNGKVTIAAVPDLSFTFQFGGKFGFGFYGNSGIEVAEFYGPQGDFERVRKDPESLPDHYFYLIGQNHSVAMDRMSFAPNGSALLLRHICMEGAKSTDSETQARQSVVRYENAFAQSQATFAESFVYFGAKSPLPPLNDIDGKPFVAGDLGLLFASCLLKVRQENGGDEWVKRFYRHLSECPPVVARQATEMASVANGQLLNWVIAASLGAGKDLSPLFHDRWRFPLVPETWQALKTVDWKKSGLTADNVFDALPIEHLPLGVAMTRPAFLTPERRKQNLLVGGSFEDGSGGTWTVGSFRRNAAAAAVEGGVAKEGQNAVVIRAPIADDARYLQKVAVKPNTRYLVSGWIKTKDVVVVEPTGRTGANLSIDAHTYEMSQSVVGTNDWRYASFIFDSGTRTEVLVCARIGFVYSTAKGEAWFDDLCMIPLGPSPVRPGAQSPPPAPGPAEKDNLLVNGSFEEGPDFPENFGYLPNVRLGSTAIKGWTVTRGNIDCTSSRHWLPGHGKRSIDLHGTPGFGGVKQTFKTVVGQRYQVSFLMAGTPLRKQPIHKLAVRAADKQQEFSFDATGKTQFAVGWERKFWEFVAVATETTLELHTLDSEDGNSGPILDDVSVIAVGVKAPGQPLKAEVEEEPTKSAANWKGWPKDAPPPAIAPFNAAQAKQHQEAWAKHLGVPIEYTNSIGMKFRLIPPGEFTMGSTPAEIEQALKHVDPNDPTSKRLAEDLIKSEGPQHKVILTQPYYLGMHEVRQQDYESVTGVNPSIFSRNGPQPAYRPNFDTSKMPVENVSWNDVTDFCSKLSFKEKLKPNYSRTGTNVIPLEGNGYRLPSEAEWEYACRAGTTTRAFFAKDEDASQFAWLANPAGGRPYPVGQLKPNPFGLVDIYGNNMEWVQDGWTPTAYEQVAGKPVVDPATSFVGAPRLMMRGVVWPFTAAGCRSSSRHSEPAGNRRHYFGVRAALSVEAVKLALANPVKAEAEPELNQNQASSWKGWSKDAPAPAIAPFNAEQAKQHQEAWAKHLGVPVEYTNSIGMKFRLIPPGEFLMGSTVAEVEAALSQVGLPRYVRDCIQSEGPQHKVILTQPVYLGVNEVTQAEYEMVIGNNPSHFASQGRGKDAVAGLDTQNHPIETVGWTDALEFCVSLSRREGRRQNGLGYRLPTEAEWEFACRAGTTTKYWIGDNEDKLLTAAWYDKNSGQRTHPVGELNANPFGLFDIHGNVWEWVQDGWEPTYYEQFREKPAIDPINQPLASSKRVFRGGNWFNTAPAGRSPSRIALEFNPPYRHYHLGIRAALSVEAVKFALANPVQAEVPPVLNDAKESLTLKGHTGVVQSVAFSPDGKWLASSSSDHAVKLWDATSGQETLTLNGHTGNVFSVAFSPDGKRLASASFDQMVKVWDAMNGQETLTLKGHTDRVWSVAFSPDGKWLASASSDQTLKVWDATSGQETLTLKGHTNWVTSVAFSSDGKRLASASRDRTIKIWDALSGQETLTLKGLSSVAMSVAFSPDRKWLASANLDKTVKVWDATSGQETLALKGHTHQVMSVAFSANGKWLASAGGDQTVKVWDATSGQESLTFKGHTGPVWGVTFSPDGKHLASASGDQTVKVWDITPRPKDDNDQKNAAQSWKGWPKDAPPPAIAPFDAAQAKKHQEAWAKHLGVPVEFTNSIGMKFVLVPPGEFLMGNSAERIEAELKSAGSNPAWQASMRSQAPQHKVILTQPIYLGIHEVTQGHYETVTGNKPSHFAATGAGREAVNGLETTQHPVDSVSWDDVAEFCAKLSEREKLKPFDFQSGKVATQQRDSGYRLPTEAEWERACRAGTVTTFWPGNTDAELLRAGWFGPNSAKRTHAVGTLRANPFGLHDVHGNVWEWVLDSLDLNYYQRFENESALDPTGPTPAGPRRGLRGGSWQYTSRDCWAAYRHSEPPSLRHRNIGFRVALSVAAVKSALANPAQAEIPLKADDDQAALTLKSATRGFTSVAFSPDGRQLVSGSIERAVKVWDAASGKEQFTMSGGFCAVFSPDGKLLASAGPENSVKIGTAATGQETLTLKGHTGDVRSAAFSADGKRVASASADHSVKVWDAASGQDLLTMKGHTDDVRSVAFSPDGSQLASASKDLTIKVWDVARGTEVRTLRGHTAEIRCVTFSPDGKRLASAGHDPIVRLWDVATGANIMQQGHHSSGVMGIAFSPDGKWLATAGCDQTLKISSVVGGLELVSLTGHTSQVVGVAWSPDGQRLASASYDRTLKVWDVASYLSKPVQHVSRKPVTRAVPAEEVSLAADAVKTARPLTNGTFVAGFAGWQLEGGANEFRHFPLPQTTETALTTAGLNKDPITGRLYQCFKVPADATELRFSVHGGADSQSTYIALWDGTQQHHRTAARNDNTPFDVAWNLVPLRNKVATLEVVDRSAFAWGFIGVHGFKLVTQQSAAATAGTRPVRVTQATQDDPLTVSLRGHEHAVLSLAVSPDGKSLASGDMYGSVMVWNVADRKLKFELPGRAGQNIVGLAFSPDGKLIATGNSKSVKLWDATNGQELKTLSGHTDLIWSVAFSPDSKRLASGSHDKSVKVWDIAKGEEITTLTGQDRPFLAVAFSPDGKWLAGSTSYGESYVMLWDTRNWKESQRLSPINGQVWSIAFSPDSQRLVTANDSGRAAIWAVLSGDELLCLQDRRGQHGQDHLQGQRDKQMKSVAFNHDGSRIVTAADSGVIKIWDAKTGQKLHELSGHAKEARGAAFSPDGKWVASGGSDFLVKVWTLTGRPQAASDGTIVKALVDPEKAQAEWQALQGTWRLTNATDFANQLPPELAIKDAHLVIKGETATVLFKNFVMGYLLTIDPTQSPKTFDMLVADDLWREALSMGIYALDRDTLQIALQPNASGRPKELKPATPPAKESPDQPHGGGMATILKFERLKEPLPRADSIFDLASWQKASRELNKLGVRVQLGKFEPLDQEESAGPGYIGVVDLPLSETDGTVPAGVWKAASSVNYILGNVSGLTDATLRQLTTHRGLYGLGLSGKSSATKDGLSLLKALPNFEYLSLTEVPQTVEILTALAESSDLRIIEISGASPSSELLAAIARFKKLEVLMLNEIDLTDEILIELSKLPSLRKLTLPKSKNFNLDKPEVSDKGLQAVKAMKKLKRLEMFGHGIDNLKLHDINEQLRAPK